MGDEEELPEHENASDCVVPPELPKEELRHFLINESAHETREVIGYVEWQCNAKRNDELARTGTSSLDEEIVEHAEKIKTERVHGIDYDVWDIHTNLGRWWVITEPTNLYSQKLMPSLDYTLSFHIGLMARVAARRELNQEIRGGLLLVTARKILQAQEKFDEADEAEDFQAVGMLCREALTSFVREIADAGLLSDIEQSPKLGDFKGWAEHVIGIRAAGASAEFTRAYLKAMAIKTWELVNWLTHAKNATRSDAQLALSATEFCSDQLLILVLKVLARSPQQCGRCGSFKITVTWRQKDDGTAQYVAECEVCSSTAERADA